MVAAVIGAMVMVRRRRVIEIAHGMRRAESHQRQVQMTVVRPAVDEGDIAESNEDAGGAVMNRRAMNGDGRVPMGRAVGRGGCCDAEHAGGSQNQRSEQGTHGESPVDRAAIRRGIKHFVFRMNRRATDWLGSRSKLNRFQAAERASSWARACGIWAALSIRSTRA